MSEAREKGELVAMRRTVLLGLVACTLASAAIACSLPTWGGSPGEIQNVEECAELSDPCEQADCIGRIAVARNDMSLCNTFSSTADYCPYFACVDYVVEETADVALCGDVAVVQVEEWCIGTGAGEMGDASLCEQISATNERDHCFYEVAESTGDTSLCDRIHYDYWKDRCME
jgi:hypothetical protein